MQLAMIRMALWRYARGVSVGGSVAVAATLFVVTGFAQSTSLVVHHNANLRANHSTQSACSSISNPATS
jgi:hypothetical protein